MPSIIINDKYCKIMGETDAAFLKELDKLFSYFIEGAEYSKAFKGYYDATGNWVRWDGRKHLLTSKLVFPIGLLKKAEQFYKDWDKDFKIIDLRKPIIKNTPLDISEKLKELKLEPRYYQLNALESTKNIERGIIRSCTGSGKTLLCAMVAAYYNKKAIIYVIGKDLLRQFYNLFIKIFGEDKVGIVGDGQCDIKDFNIVSIWSAGVSLGLKKSCILVENENSDEFEITKYEELRTLIKNAKVQIFDESHYVRCETIQKIYKVSNPDLTLGVSGTPTSGSESDLLINATLGDIIIDISASELIKGGYLAQPKIKFIKVPYNPDLVSKNYKQIYKEYIVENKTRNDLILDYAKKLTDKNYKTLILFESIKHGNILYDLISPHIKCALLSGKDDVDERDRVKAQITNGDIKLVLASRIFTTGVDIPELSALILAGAGRSKIGCIQRVGRVIRKTSDKEFVYVIDFDDNCKFLSKHSKIRFSTYSMEDGFEVYSSK